jgi:hypothetical protein
VTEDDGARPAPLALDSSVLVAIARGDVGVMTLIQGYDADGVPAHVAAIADAAICPILTLDAAMWRVHVNNLDEPLHIIEIADPEAD